jgi:hypothetical protein
MRVPVELLKIPRIDETRNAIIGAATPLRANIVHNFGN